MVCSQRDEYQILAVVPHHCLNTLWRRDVFLYVGVEWAYVSISNITKTWCQRADCNELFRIHVRRTWYKKQFIQLLGFHTVRIREFFSSWFRENLPDDYRVWTGSSHWSKPVNVCVIDGLVQDCSNPGLLAMELLQSCINPSLYIYRIAQTPTQTQYVYSLAMISWPVKNIWYALSIFIDRGRFKTISYFPCVGR